MSEIITIEIGTCNICGKPLLADIPKDEFIEYCKLGMRIRGSHKKCFDKDKSLSPRSNPND